MTHFPIKDLKRAEYNPRVMPEGEMDALMLSIETHGFVEPIVVNIAKDRYGTIVGGHQRLTAVEKLIAKGIIPKGIKDTAQVSSVVQIYVIPCFEVDLTLEAEKLLNIALNNIRGKFDEDKLYEVIFSMKDSSALPSTGFDAAEIGNILSGDRQSHSQEEGNGGCVRCKELKGQLDAHIRRSGHTTILEKQHE